MFKRITSPTSALWCARILVGCSLLFALLVLTGCAVFKRPPVVDARNYRPIPEGYLQPCELPAVPVANGLLSKAFVQAMKCAELGNDDKARIRDLIAPQ